MPNEEHPARSGPEPLLRVVAGHPEPDEVAALVVALARQHAANAGAAAPAHRAVSGWAARRGLLRAPLAAGRDAWRRSFLPG